MGKLIDYEEISKRIPVTKIIVKDLMKGTYREGHTTTINWEEPEPPVPEQKKFPRKEIITIILFVLIIGSTAIIAIKIISKKLSAKKEIAEQTVLPVEQPRQFYSQKIPIQRPSVPVPVQISNRKQYSYTGKEKIYTWTENGIHHYTNLKDVAESKNAVELK